MVSEIAIGLIVIAYSSGSMLGQWSVVICQWSVASDQWPVVSGQWSVVSGLEVFQ